MRIIDKIKSMFKKKQSLDELRAEGYERIAAVLLDRYLDDGILNKYFENLYLKKFTQLTRPCKMLLTLRFCDSVDSFAESYASNKFRSDDEIVTLYMDLIEDVLKV